MKKKKTATILAFLTGWLGIHRFYLGQPGLGVVYLLLFFFSIGIVPFILGLIDGLMFATMKEEIFDLKYNRKEYNRTDRRFEREYTRDSNRRQREDRYLDRKRQRDREVLQRRTEARKAPKRRPTRVPTSRANPYKQSGVEKFKQYDYNGAISDFHKALEMSPKDIATHFNLACAYSLNEKTAKAMEHLKRAISFGYNNFDNIRNHDALAFLRIQPEYEAFAETGFKMESQNPSPPKTQSTTREAKSETANEPPQENLLEQLKKLAELRQKGLLSSEQYAVEKRRLLE